MDLDDHDRYIGLEPSEAMAVRKAVQQEEKDATARLRWYTRDYAADEMKIMGNAELNKLLDDFYGVAEQLNEKEPEENPPIERYQYEVPSGLPNNHTVPMEDTIHYYGQSVCKSPDPRFYWKHPFGCGCNQGSHSAAAKTTNLPNTSTAEACSHLWSRSKFLHGCESQERSPAVTSPFRTEVARNISFLSFETGFDYEETEGNESFLPVALSFPETAARKPEVLFNASQDDQSPVPSESETSFNIYDWVHEQL